MIAVAGLVLSFAYSSTDRAVVGVLLADPAHSPLSAEVSPAPTTTTFTLASLYFYRQQKSRVFL